VAVVAGRLGDACSDDADCTAVLRHSRCDDVTVTCRCDVTAGYRAQPDGSCDIRTSVYCTGWLKIKYLAGEYAVSPQPVV